MNYRLQLSPISRVRESQIEFSMAEAFEAYRARWEEAEFLRSWLVYDCGELNHRRSLNWNAILGLGFAVLVSVGCWTGLGLMIVYVVK